MAILPEIDEFWTCAKCERTTISPNCECKRCGFGSFYKTIWMYNLEDKNYASAMLTILMKNMRSFIRK